MTVEEIEDWLRSLNVKPLTRNSFWLRLSILFSFSLTRKWCSENPLADVSKAKHVAGKIGVLSLEQFASLLGAASLQKPFLILPSAASYGLRSSEQALKLGRCRSGGRPDHAGYRSDQTASRRHVTILPALAAWLEPSDLRRKGRLCPVGLRARLEADRRRVPVFRSGSTNTRLSTQLRVLPSCELFGFGPDRDATGAH